MKTREIVHRQGARPSSDGDGVRLLRVFGGADPQRFDPFLMLDEFGSDRPEDYRGGFPSHPHRGFETVTYMLEGRMEHRDHLGNTGLLDNGSVQWMTAGRGIIHSEMPLQNAGLMHGFQLWVNLPAADKMQPARYRDVAASEIPVYRIGNTVVTAIAGAIEVDGSMLEGHFPPDRREINFFDIALASRGELAVAIDPEQRVLIYCFAGDLQVGDQGKPLGRRQLAELSPGDQLRLRAPDGARCLLLSGKPLEEPVVQYGPFVMNSREQIEQALEDYRAGNFV